MKRVALIIGINRYQDPRITPLTCAEMDALALKFLLSDRCGFSKVFCLINDQATKRRINEALRELCADLGPEDVLLFYFAGHGYEDPQNDHPWLLPVDVRLSDIEDALQPDLIPIRGVEAASHRCGAARFCFVDACRMPLHSERRDASVQYRDLAAAGLRRLVEEDAAGRAPWVLVHGCGARQRAHEVASLGRGVFSQALEEVLLGYLKQGRELAFPGSVLEELATGTSRLLDKHAQGGRQDPMILANRGRVVLLPGNSMESAESATRAESLSAQPLALPKALLPMQPVEFPMPPLRIDLTPQTKTVAAGPHLPPMSDEILELQGWCTALEEALAQLKDDRHSQLEPLLAARAGAAKQESAFRTELAARAPAALAALSAPERRELEAAFRQGLDGSLARLGKLCPQISEPELLAYLRLLRQVVRAEVIGAQARRDYDASKQVEANRLHTLLEERRAGLLRWQEADFAGMLDLLASVVPPGSPFPEATWSSWEEELERRRLPWTLGECYDRAMVHFDEKAWNLAVGSDSLAGWQTYLQAFPQGNHVSAAKTSISELLEAEAWQAACAREEAAAYNDYLTAHPGGKHAAQATEWLDTARDEAAWAVAVGLGTLRALQDYRSQFPNGRHVESVIQREQVEAAEALKRAEAEHERAQELERIQMSEANKRVETEMELRRAQAAKRAEVEKLELERLAAERAEAVLTAERAAAAARVEFERLSENSLGMKFVPVAGTDVWFSIWDTRVRDYREFTSATRREWLKPSFAQGPTHPAVDISWDDAVAFCAWLTRREQAAGKLRADEHYRLPTDAEWSVAVGLPSEPDGISPKDKSGRIMDFYPWGKKYPPPVGAGNYDQRLHVDSFEHTSPVGSFAPNCFGLYDMGGNVWQWCQDYYFAHGQGAKYHGARVLRGASWSNVIEGVLRSSFRSHFLPMNHDLDVGFRVVIAGVPST